MAKAINPFAFNPSEVTNYQRSIYRFRRDPLLLAIGAYLTTMKLIPDDSVGTACTDCVRYIKYSPLYFSRLTVEECISALLHEVHHKFLNFFPRFERWAARHSGCGKSRSQLLRIFNEAQDFWINHNIKHKWKYPLGSGWLYDPDLNPDTMTTEMMADHLLRNPQARPQANQPPPNEQGGEGNPDNEPAGDAGPDDPGDDAKEGDGGDEAGDSGSEPSDADGEGADGDGNDGAAGDGDVPPTDVGEGGDIELPEEYKGDINNKPSESEMRDIEAKNKQDVAQSMRAAKGYGAGDSDPFSAQADDVAYAAEFDFERELKKWASDSAKTGPYTWQRTHRKRRTAQGFVFPSRRGKEIGTAVFVIDSSGSTTGPMVRYFLDEVTRALKTVNYKRAVVVWCSDEVAHAQEFTKAEADATHSLFDGRIYRCGYGTNFPPAFEYIAEHYDDARCITYLTDGGVGEYDVEESAEIVRSKLNNVPVLWAIAEEHGYAYVKRFQKWVMKYRIGRTANLPMEKIEEAA